MAEACSKAHNCRELGCGIAQKAGWGPTAAFRRKRLRLARRAGMPSSAFGATATCPHGSWAISSTALATKKAAVGRIGRHPGLAAQQVTYGIGAAPNAAVHQIVSMNWRRAGN